MTMQHKLDRAIADLEVEAKMLEAHAEKLSIMARQLADPNTSKKSSLLLGWKEPHRAVTNDDILLVPPSR